MSYLNRIGCIFLLLLTGCQPPKTVNANTTNHELAQKFEIWKKNQNQQTLQQYQQYLKQQLKYPPTLFELSYNQHISKQECLIYQFAIAPESQWKNIVKPLQLMEKLYMEGIVPYYKIVSIYRGELANQCSRGAPYSKHLSNHAVDFQLIQADGQVLAELDQHTLSQLCQFWKKEGAKNNMGLGTYANNKFHIDTAGYRTWGQNYKRESSLCLK